ncbi:hypothetical protein ACFVDH_13750 [Streptomyces sp. NPDC057674]|uniref:hypothetical protein n=1 Tax=Streptomyces sp. NPDC057674 TaxID=3346203 RepID=UPI00368A5B33
MTPDNTIEYMVTVPVPVTGQEDPADVAAGARRAAREHFRLHLPGADLDTLAVDAYPQDVPYEDRRYTAYRWFRARMRGPMPE